MANTFELISAVTVGSGGSATITFSSIPSTYTDLCVKMSLRSAGTSTNSLLVKPNGSTTTLSQRDLRGSGSAATSTNSSTQIASFIDISTDTASTFSNVDIYFTNYASSTTYKSFSIDNVTENNATAAWTQLQAGLWSNNSAITSLTFGVNGSNNFTEFSTAYLYGVKNA